MNATSACTPLAPAFPLFGAVCRRGDNGNLPDAAIVALLPKRGAVSAGNADSFIERIGPSSK